MAEVLRPNVGFHVQRIEHCIFAFVIQTLGAFIQVEYQTKEESPFDTHRNAILTFVIALFIYGAASVVEAKLQSQQIYHLVPRNVRLLAGALAAATLVVIVVPSTGWIISGIWGSFFIAWVGYNTYQQLYLSLYEAVRTIHDMWRKLMEIAEHQRARETQELPA